MRKTPSDWGREPHMFYRQSSMFIEYLAGLDRDEFRLLLLAVLEGDCLPDAMRKGYGRSLNELWLGFLQAPAKSG